MKLYCKKKVCLNEWDYKGKSPFYATCPRCYNKVRLNPEQQNIPKTVFNKLIGK